MKGPAMNDVWFQADLTENNQNYFIPFGLSLWNYNLKQKVSKINLHELMSYLDLAHD